jgi:SET domain-containing protein
MADLIVRASASKGRGVFANRAFAAGETIEICPVIPLPAEDVAKLDQTYLYNYYFGWGPDNQGAAIALGYGSLYNHSYTPNAVYRKNLADDTVQFVALTPIAPGEEIFVKYNYPGAGDDGPLWFDVAEPE